MQTLARRYILKGRVQGVGFRYFVYDVARRLGIRGWVRNLPNGDVEIEAEGEEESLRQFLLQIKGGPPLAVVRELQVQEIPARHFQTFQITR